MLYRVLERRGPVRHEEAFLGERRKRSIVWSIPSEELAQIVRASSSFAGILRHFGLINKGGNCQTLKRRLEAESIDYSHVSEGRSANLGRRFTRSENFLGTALVENSNASKWYLKQRLIRDGLLANNCASCGIGPSWNG